MIEISRRLLHCVREYDTVARMGGDEFVLLLKDIEDLGSLTLILERALESIRQPIQIDQWRIQVSCSIGYTLYPHDLAEASTLLSHADEAMYMAKRAGKNQIRRYSL